MPTKPHFVVDPDFANSAEVLSIPRRYRLAAVGAWTLAGSWSANKMTDGFVPDEVLDALGITPLLRDQLIAVGLWTRVVDNPESESRTGSGPTPDRVRTASGPGAQFNNWPKWQKTKAQWVKGRASNAERQQRYRNSKSTPEEPPESHESDALQPALAAVNGNVVPIARNASVTRKESKEEKYIGGGVRTEPTTARPNGPPPPDSSCPEHPDGTGKACRDCQRNRERAEATAAFAAADHARAVEAERQRKADCPRCLGTGMRPVDPDDPDPFAAQTRCTHEAPP